VTVFLNGSFLPLEQAKVSPLDRGFLFGDGIYEVIPSYRGVPFLLDAHLERLRRSLSEIRLADPMGEAGWREMLEQLLALNPGGDRGIYLQVTRGAAPRDHAFPAATEATVFAMVNPIQPPRPELAEQGVGAILLPDERWGRCDIKAVTLLANVLARQTAFEQGAIEAILLREGRLTEGAASNVFVVRGGVVRTPPLDRGILPGITRRFVLDLLEGQSRPVFEETVAESDLRTADEIWLTSSTKEILAVTRLDGQPVGSGRPGPVWRETLDLYQRVKNESLGAVVRENGDD
jgi:D-alanine transaminase